MIYRDMIKKEKRCVNEIILFLLGKSLPNINCLLGCFLDCLYVRSSLIGQSIRRTKGATKTESSATKNATEGNRGWEIRI